MPRAFVYGIVISLGVLGLSSDMVVLGFIFLIIPGLVLLLAPTAALYLPFADLLFTGARRRRGDLASLGLAGVLLVAVGPALVGELTLRHHTSGSPAAPAVSAEGAPERILFVRFEPSPNGPRRPWGQKIFWQDQADCEEVCAQLLLSGRVREVVRPLWLGDRPVFPLRWSDHRRAMIYSLAPPSDCHTTGQSRVPADLLAAIGASGRCISGQEAGAPEADRVLTLTVTNVWSEASLQPVPLDMRRLNLWSAWRCAGDACDKFATAVNGDASPLTMPFHLDIDTVFPTPRRHWSRRTVTLDTTQGFPWSTVGLASAPRRTSGFATGVAQAAPVSRSAFRAAATRVLAASAERGQPLQPEERAVIQSALSDMKDLGDLEAEDLAVLEAVVRHPTLKEPLGLYAVFRKHPAAAAKLENVLVETYLELAAKQSQRLAGSSTSIERASAGDYRQYFRREIGNVIKLLPPDRLEAHRAELLAALADPALERDAREVFSDLRR